MKRIKICVLTVTIAMVQSALYMEWEGEVQEIENKREEQNRATEIVRKGVLEGKDNLIFKGLTEGASINMRVDEGGNRLIHYFLNRDYFLLQDERDAKERKRIRNKIKKSISTLIVQYNADLNIQNDDDDTPLHLAVLLCDFDIVELLIGEGADKSIRDRGGFTPYDLAISDNVTDQNILDLLNPEK